MNGVNNEESYHKIDYLDIAILDCIYNNETTVMSKIIKSLKGMATRQTISKRIMIMAKIGLFHIIEGTNPICIKRINNEEPIKRMIINKKTKWGLIQ